MVFIVFAALAALINYELNSVLYTSAAPRTLFEYEILTTILPFLLGAVISFIVANVSSRAIKDAVEEKIETKENETQQKLL